MIKPLLGMVEVFSFAKKTIKALINCRVFPLTVYLNFNRFYYFACDLSFYFIHLDV